MEKRTDILGTIPPSARLVRAVGSVSTLSLEEEYDPSPERRAEFVRELRNMELAERESVISDRSVRL